VFLLKGIKIFLLGLTKELLPDRICKVLLILKSDRFWFTSPFTFLGGSLWALFGCGVACLGETSGIGELSDSRHALILDFVEAVKEIAFGPGLDDRTEMGKHSIRCQTSSVFKEMAFLIGLLSPEAKEGRAAVEMRWIGWLRDLRV